MAYNAIITNVFIKCIGLLSGAILICCLNFSCKKEENAPEAPATLTVTPLEYSNSLKWSPSDGAEYYRIYWSTESSEVSTASNKIDNIVETEYTHVDLSANTTYYYKVSAVNAIGESNLSVSTSSSPLPPFPSTPTNLRVYADIQSLSISWNSVDVAQSYTLFYTTDGSTPNESSLKIENITSTTYNHTGLNYNLYYKYCVCAINIRGASALSSSVSAKPIGPPLSTPTGLTASGATSVTLTWDTHPELGVTYTVVRSGSEIASGITQTSYIDNSPVQGKYNKYKIKAVLTAEGRESAYTPEVIVPIYKTINETERNGPETTLTTLSWCYWMEYATASKELMYINGAYSGSYAGYNAYMYKYYDWDLFQLTFDNNDVVKVTVINGTMSGSWPMTLSLEMHMKTSTGGETPLSPGNPSISASTYTWNILYGAAQTIKHGYLMVSMPNNLINSGPYSYKLRIDITRN